jgi:hypothetical protein
MMAHDCPECRITKGHHRHVAAVRSMALHDIKLNVGQPARLAEYLQRRVKLADVVQFGPGLDELRLVGREPHSVRHRGGVASDPS